MSCKYKMTTKSVTSARCLEMIRMFESWISMQNHLKNCKYNSKERAQLSKVIKDNPTHVWLLKESGLIHYEL